MCSKLTTNQCAERLERILSDKVDTWTHSEGIRSAHILYTSSSSASAAVAIITATVTDVIFSQLFLKPVHTVDEFGDYRRCRRFLRQSHFSATVWTGL